MMDLNEAKAIADTVPGYMEDFQLLAIGEVAQGCQGVFIEVGCYLGKTTKMVSLLCPGTVIAIDQFRAIEHSPWMGDDNAVQHESEFRQNLATEIASGKTVLYPYESCVAAGMLRQQGITADVIFIDADHVYESIRRDIAAYLPLVKSGGLFFGHDYDESFPGVQQAVAELLPGAEGKLRMWYYRVP
jgi:hypothetical protein